MFNGVGPIIILNGTSSTGKSTLASAIADELKDSLVVRCDDVAVSVFHRLAADRGIVIPDDGPKDLMNLLYTNTEIAKILDDEVNTEMYKIIRLHANQGKPVINDNAWVRPQDVEDCQRELSGYKIVRVFVHCSLDDILERVLRRNQSNHLIDHRSITLPFTVLPMFYKAQPSPDAHTIDIWERAHMNTFIHRMQKEFEARKPTYNYAWQKEGEDFFSKIDAFYKRLKLDSQESVPLTPCSPYDYVVNTSSMSTSECAKMIATWYTH
jgi:chloramphenicol 3-O-phosphotransferase